MPNSFGETEAALAKAVSEMPVDPEVEAANSGTASPAGASVADETAGKADPSKPEGSGKDAPVDPAIEESKGPVPYDRFNEVVRQKNEALENLKKREEAMAEEADRLGEARSRAQLEQIARMHPELGQKIYGPTWTPPDQPEKLPDDPVQREIALLKRDNQEQKDWRQKQDRQEMIEDLETRATAAMKKHPIFERTQGEMGEIAQSVIAQRILAEPKVPIETHVENVAKGLRGFEEKIKADYKQVKIETTKKLPAGVGSGGAAPPGQGPTKHSLDRPGELSRALAAAISQSRE